MVSEAQTPSGLPPGPLPVRGLRVVCLLLALALCAPIVRTLPSLWDSTDFLAHGYLIPLVAGFLLFANRQELVEAWRSAEPPRWGAVAALGAGSVFAVALIGDVGFVAGLMTPMVLLATLYAIGGLPLVRPAALPIGFLVLMVPPPGFVIEDVLIRLKLFVSAFAVHLLQLSGQTVTAQGNQILVPGHTLFVADACSGMNSIVALLPLGCVIAYFLCKDAWRRAVVVASIIPLAVGANILRVVVTVSLVSTYGIDFAQGLLHESFGLTTYILGTLALVGVAKLVQQ